MRRKKLKGKYTDIKVSSLKKFISKNKLKLITISSFLVVLGTILLINSPKDNIFKSSYKKLLANNGIYTEEIKSIDITSDDYDEPGSFKVTKKAEWTDYGKAKLTITADSIIKEKNNNKKDIILVMDISGSMEGNKLDKAKEDAINLANRILKNQENQIGLITFDTNAEIIFSLTNDLNTINEKINSLTTKGATNYNDALKKVDNMLENYQEQKNRDLIVLFLTDGNPCEDTSNEVSTYKILKEKYPSLTIQGIQYEMGSNITESLKNISDNQFNASIDTLGNILIEASTNPAAFDEFIITDFIDTDYFEVPNEDDIKPSIGSYEVDGNKITWNLGDSYVTGNKATLIVNLTQKERYIEEEGFYPTNEKETIKYKLGEENETISSHDTPVLKNTYEVIYNANAPSGCNIENPEIEKQMINKVVTMKTPELYCDGYKFNGWGIANDDDIKYINKSSFKMPAKNVYVNATWSKQSINKSMDGTIHEKSTLYKVLENETKIGTYARKYSGEHADAYDRSGTKNIYYWYGSNNTNATAILDKFNVIFGGFCWQMLRTTDTGGVKIIYNGVPSNGTCNNSGPAQQIGTSKFNPSSNSPAYVGYMYNTAYPYQSKNVNPTNTETMLSSTSLSTSYWYAHDAIYGTLTQNRYNLNEPYQVSSTADYSNLVGEYTFRNSSQTYTNASVSYIAAVNGSTMYYISLSNGNNLEYYNYTYTFGDDYTKNGNGTYTINNPTTINRLEWYSNYSAVKNKYVCKNATNNTCSELWYATSTSATSMTYIKEVNTYKYAKGFTYENGSYKLNDESVSFWNMSDITNKNSINNHHYTCFNESGECTILSYIYYIDRTIPYYINLTNGKSVDDALNEMLYDEDVNTNDSTIKTYLENWYQSNLSSYTSYLEDIVFCNDRSIRTKNGWDPNGGSTSNNLLFKENNPTKDLSCSNNTDRFSTLNEKAKLAYPIGLASQPEVNMLNNNNIRKTGQYYWLASPSGFNVNSAVERRVYTTGELYHYLVSVAYGARPVVSVRPGTEYSDGDGSRNNPYIIDTEGD